MQIIREAGGTVFTLNSTEIPLFARTQLFVWPLFNILATITACVFAGLCRYKLYLAKPKKEELRNYIWHLASLAGAMLALILLFSTSGFGGVMVIFDSISILFTLLLALGITAWIFIHKTQKRKQKK